MGKLFTGVATALVTPFNNGKVDYFTLQNLINRQIDDGVDCLVILGTTGEISTLTDAEKHKIINTAINTNRNRVPLIFGIGGNNPPEIIKLGHFVKQTAQKIASNGDNNTASARVGIMITAPYYNKGTQDGIYKFFAEITNAVRLPAIIYNIPARTGVNIEPDTLYRISTLPFVAGIKEASGNIPQIAEVVMKCPNTAVYSGDDTIALPCYAVGCCGIISVASNLSVQNVKHIYELYRKGRSRSALMLFQIQMPFYKSLFKQVNPIPIKYYLSKENLIKNEMRLPLTPME
jgi:4-hydroxy-tetrahydrodipicolinate synthase